MGEAASQPVVVLLGAGRVATHLAPALIGAGYHIAQIYSRTMEAARTLAEPLGVAYTDDIDAISPGAHQVLGHYASFCRTRGVRVTAQLWPLRA